MIRPLTVVLLAMTFSPIHTIYQSYLQLSSSGSEFRPRNPVQLLLETTFRTRLMCAASCNQHPSCRAIDYDSSSRRCRLFEGDLTTGTILASASATSVVGTVIVSPSMFAQTHGQSCQACADSRYETCDANTSTCQCRAHTFWNNSTCTMQLFENDMCSQVGLCRSDLNLTCAQDYSGQFTKCSSVLPNYGLLHAARGDHIASTLTDGTILVAGGFDSVQLNSVEVFDPTTRIWTQASAMNIARQRPTATVLGDGTVLVTGGCSGSPSTSAELYNPVAKNWSIGSDMSISRTHHSAVKLDDGSVLVTGGIFVGYIVPSAEIYDPVAKTWKPVANMNDPRNRHTCSKLLNGKVLVTGGYNGIFLSSAELYDPVTNTWTLVGSMAVGREDHTASILNDGTVLITGGSNSTGAVKMAELYDPTYGTWTRVGSMNVERYRHTASVLANGTVLVTGGLNGAVLNSVEIFSPTTRNWTTLSNMYSARQSHAASVLADGQVLLSGGYNGPSLKTYELH